MRSDLENNKMHEVDWRSGKWSLARKDLSGPYTIFDGGPILHFLDPNGAHRDVTLPALGPGKVYVVFNNGSANNLVVKSAAGGTVTTLLPLDVVFLFSDDNEWAALRGWASLGVFTNTVNGLVPAPNSVVPGSLFLRDDGQWGQVQVVGIVDAFKFITDGTNTAIGSGPDTFRLRSSTNKIGITVTNNEAVFGDNVNLTVLEAQVNHNLLLNYVADQHVAHTGVVLTAGTGLSGGGDISASRTFNLDLNDLTTDTPVLADTFAFYDISGGDTNKATLTTLNGILDHNGLLNYSANRHIDHSVVTVTGGTGLTGGGDLTASRVLSLNITGLSTDTVATGDEFAFYDISGGDHNKITFGTLNSSLDHNSLTNYVANRHIDHTAVTLTAGAGLTGGGDISASRTFDVGAGVGIAVNANDIALNFNGLTTQTVATGDIFAFWDISASTHSKATFSALNSALDHNSLTNYVANQHIDHTTVTISTTEGVQGGGTIAANRTFKLDINGLTADATPDAANDYIVTWDASASLHKKVLITNLPGGLNITGLTAATPAIGDEIPIYDISAAGNRKITVKDLSLFYRPIPQGRITLTTNDPVMDGNTTGNGTIYYTPYLGNKWVVHDGTALIARTFTERQQATSDTTKSPAATAANNNYDIFGWDDSGTDRISRGPPWTSGTGGSATVRGTGAGSTELVLVDGILMNAQNITNGPAAQRGVYLGTVRTRAADGLIDWHYGGAANGGTAASFCVWNMFNRVEFTAQVEDTLTSFSSATANSIEAVGASTNNRINYVVGLAEDTIVSRVYGQGAAGASGFLALGVGHDTTGAFSGLVGGTGANIAVPLVGSAKFNGDLGFHFVQLCEGATNSAGVVYGTTTVSIFHTGIELTGKF